MNNENKFAALTNDHLDENKPKSVKSSNVNKSSKVNKKNVASSTSKASVASSNSTTKNSKPASQYNPNSAHNSKRLNKGNGKNQPPKFTMDCQFDYHLIAELNGIKRAAGLKSRSDALDKLLLIGLPELINVYSQKNKNFKKDFKNSTNSWLRHILSSTHNVAFKNYLNTYKPKEYKEIMKYQKNDIKVQKKLDQLKEKNAELLK